MKRIITSISIGLICWLLFSYFLCATLWFKEVISTVLYVFLVILIGAGAISLALALSVFHDEVKKALDNIEIGKIEDINKKK